MEYPIFGITDHATCRVIGSRVSAIAGNDLFFSIEEMTVIAMQSSKGAEEGIRKLRKFFLTVLGNGFAY
jgi:hypothetical protein